MAELVGPWQPVPVIPDEAVVEAADRACRTSIGVPLPDVDLVVVDARGGGQLSLFYAGADDAYAECPSMTVGDDGDIRSMGGGGVGTIGELSEPIESGEIRVESHSGSGRGQTAQTTMVGRAGSAIAQVTLRAPSQEPILATLANGWWSAWWPSPAQGRIEISGFDADGMLITSDRW